MKKKITWLAAGALCVVSMGVGAAASGIITRIPGGASSGLYHYDRWSETDVP